MDDLRRGVCIDNAECNCKRLRADCGGQSTAIVKHSNTTCNDADVAALQTYT